MNRSYTLSALDGQRGNRSTRAGCRVRTGLPTRSEWGKTSVLTGQSSLFSHNQEVTLELPSMFSLILPHLISPSNIGQFCVQLTTTEKTVCAKVCIPINLLGKWEKIINVTTAINDNFTWKDEYEQSQKRKHKWLFYLWKTFNSISNKNNKN